MLGDRVSQVNAHIASTAGQNTIRDASYLAKYRQNTGTGPMAPFIESPRSSGPWRDGYKFHDSETNDISIWDSAKNIAAKSFELYGDAFETVFEAGYDIVTLNYLS
jgi:hypothetical protein